MSTPPRDARARACATSARLPRFGASPLPSLLLDYRWLLVCLGLSLLPLLAGAQAPRASEAAASTVGESAIGLRVDPGYAGRTGGAYGRQLLRNTQLSYRYQLRERWSLEALLGYSRSPEIPVSFPTFTVGQRFRTVEGAVLLQREWALEKNPKWHFYAGGGLGVRHSGSQNVNPADGSAGERTSTDLTLESAVGFRYRMSRAPLELDLGLRPRYGGRGVGLDVPLNVGLRWRLGGKP